MLNDRRFHAEADSGHAIHHNKRYVEIVSAMEQKYLENPAISYSEQIELARVFNISEKFILTWIAQRRQMDFVGDSIGTKAASIPHTPPNKSMKESSSRFGISSLKSVDRSDSYRKKRFVKGFLNFNPNSACSANSFREIHPAPLARNGDVLTFEKSQKLSRNLRISALLKKSQRIFKSYAPPSPMGTPSSIPDTVCRGFIGNTNQPIINGGERTSGMVKSHSDSLPAMCYDILDKKDKIHGNSGLFKVSTPVDISNAGNRAKTRPQKYTRRRAISFPETAFREYFYGTKMLFPSADTSTQEIIEYYNNGTSLGWNHEQNNKYFQSKLAVPKIANVSVQRNGLDKIDETKSSAFDPMEYLNFDPSSPLIGCRSHPS